MGTKPVKSSLETRLGRIGFVYLVVIWGLSMGLGLGSSNQLTYHEAFVAQGAREILASGSWWYPTIGGRPWLEKPPLPFWLVAALGWCAGEVSPVGARLPSAFAALGLVLGICILTMRRYGAAMGIVAGAIQATTAWTVFRGRLAEADMLLACVVTWTMLAFDRLRAQELPQASVRTSYRWSCSQLVFFGLVGLMSLIKGTGFGAALVLSVVYRCPALG